MSCVIEEVGCRMAELKLKWRNRQTRTVQVRVPARAWGFNSPLEHEIPGLTGDFLLEAGAVYHSGALYAANTPWRRPVFTQNSPTAGDRAIYGPIAGCG